MRAQEEENDSDATSAAHRAKRSRTEPRGAKRKRDDNGDKAAEAKQRRPRAVANIHALRGLTSNIMIRGPTAATSLDLLAQAQSASRERDTDARVTTTEGGDRTGPVWSENRTWDPGD